MLFVIHGGDTCTSREKLDVLTSKFAQKYGAENITYVRSDADTPTKLRELTHALPFLQAKRMIVVYDIDTHLNKSHTAFSETVGNIPEECIVVFFQSTACKKTSLLLKAVGKTAHLEVCEPIVGADLTRWIIGRVNHAGTSIAPDAVALLASSAGHDLGQLAQEIEKLTLLAGSEPITIRHVRLLVRTLIDTDVFALIDAVSRRDIGRALQELQNLRSLGTADLYVFSMIVYQFRTLVQLRSALDAQMSADDYQTRMKLHPYAAQKSLSLAKQFSRDELNNLYTLLCAIDRDIKTGKRDAATTLEQLLVALCTKQPLHIFATDAV